MGVPTLKLTRVERVCKHNKLTLRDLPGLPNVFGTLHCRDARAALADLGADGVPPVYRSFVHDACAYRGLRPDLGQIEIPVLEKRVPCPRLLGHGRHLVGLAGRGRPRLLPRACSATGVALTLAGRETEA